MDTKNKPGQKGGQTKSQTRPGTNLQRNQGEQVQPKVSDTQKQKEGQTKSGKK